MQEKKKQLKQAKTIENVYNSAYWHLSQQDFTHAEMLKKLNRKTENQEWIEIVMADLIGKNYIKSDFDFAVRYAEAAFSNENGRISTQYKLQKRGIPEHDVVNAIEHVLAEYHFDFYEISVTRLQRVFEHFHNTTKEKLYSQMTNKGFSRSEIENAIANHPAKDTLKTQLEIKAAKADLSTEIMKLYRKGKGKKLIRNELRARLINLDDFEDILYQLEESGDIDFYQSCQDQLNKKSYDLNDRKDKPKAYAYLARKGFESDEIKEAMKASDEE